ncbi:MAG: HAD family hydrolase [Acidobacteriota bacterium]
MATAQDPLSAWTETAEKQAILEFVDRVTVAGSSDYLARRDRVATFDVDGTLACEKPDYMEVAVAAARLCELANQRPEDAQTSIDQAACDGDFAVLDAQVEEVLLEAFADEGQGFYTRYVERFLATARHPRFDRPYGQLAFLPMLQLVDFLRENGFTVYLVSGSQQGFTRSFGASVLDLPPAQAIGHAVELSFSAERTDPLIRQRSFRPPSVDGAGKAEVIRQRIGRRPVLAFGNSMGDLEMLRYATGGEGPSLGLILVHDDPREYVYEDQELIDHAESFGWQIVRMKRSFAEVFPP